MGLNDVAFGERLHIGFFGMRNAGKSSLVNAVTGQQLSVVSDVKGTTTDPVKKAMELLPLGPVVIIDTPGLDDEGELGALRVQKSKQILSQTDIAVLVVDSISGLTEQDRELVALFQKREIPYVVAYNKSDLLPYEIILPNKRAIYTSTTTGRGVAELKSALGDFAKLRQNRRTLVAEFLQPGDIVVLVTPIDESAPKGRLILPQQLTLREILDANAIAVTCQTDQLQQTLEALSRPPRMVITDSQDFEQVNAIVPPDVLLTSFSILVARYKDELKQPVMGVAALSRLIDGDRVLISEGCTHHRQCNDIGAVQIPRLIKNFYGVEPQFSFTSGCEFPDDLSDYALIIHCGGCMLNESEVRYRIKSAKDANVPVVNYGVAIAQMYGILRRSLQLFPDIIELLEAETTLSAAV